MKIRILLVLTLLSFSMNIFAYEEEVDKFFKLYESGKIVEAVDSIYSSNKWILQKPDEVHLVKTQLQNLKGLVGGYHGKVLLGNESIKDRLVHVTYLGLFERQPIRFEFVFYRPKDSWVIYSFSFDDSIDDELQKFARDKIAGYNVGS